MRNVNDHTPRGVLADYLLHTLRKHSGRLTVRALREIAERELVPLLTAWDLEGLASSRNEPRWWNHMRFVRQTLVDAGILAKKAPRGTWQLQ